MKALRISQLIKQLQDIQHSAKADIEAWVQWHDPEHTAKMCYGERITEVRLSPLPPGEPVCIIDAQPA